VPLGLAGLFHFVGIWPFAVVSLFLPYRAVLLLKPLDGRFHEHLPPSEGGGYLANRGYLLTVLAVLLGFGWLQERLDKPTFSFLLGVAFFELWPLLLLLLMGVLRLLKPGVFGPKGEGWLALLAFFAPLGVDLVIYAMWIPPSRVLTLPLAAGAVLTLFITFAVMAVLGERRLPPSEPPQPQAGPE
jgi:hypothetical protein